MKTFWLVALAMMACCWNARAEDVIGSFAVGGVLTGIVGDSSVTAPITRSLYANFPGGGLDFVRGSAREADVKLLKQQADGPRFSSLGYRFELDSDCSSPVPLREVCSQREDEDAPFAMLQVFVRPRAPGLGLQPDPYARARASAQANGGAYTEFGTTYYALEVGGREAVMSCEPNIVPHVFRWRYMCSTSLIVTDQVWSRSSHYLYASFVAEQHMGQLTDQIGDMLDLLLD